MAYFTIPQGRSKRRKPTASERSLEEEWEKLLARHSKPLERGAKAKGVRAKYQPVSATVIVCGPRKQPKIELPSLPMKGPATKPAVDPLAEAKRVLSSRVDLGYHKGGLQYLTDEDLKEREAGGNRRRS